MDKTLKGIFTDFDGIKTETDLIYDTREVLYGKDDDLSIAGLPYGNEAFSMYIIVPGILLFLKTVMFSKDLSTELIRKIGM